MISVIERMASPAVTLSLQDLRSGGWFPDSLVGRRSLSSVVVTPNTALALPSYYAAMRAISEDVARMPFLTYRRLRPGKEEATEHPVYALLRRRPNEESTSMSFREVLTSWALGWGNGWAEIERDRRGVPVNLWPIHPSRMTVTRDHGASGELRFTAHNNDGTVTAFRGVDVFNLHGLGGDGITGYSIARLGLESIGLALAAQSYGSAFFGNATRASGALVHPTKLSPEARRDLREQWEQQYTGPENAFKTVILQEGMRWERFSIPPEEAQYLETRHLQIEEMARWFRITPHKLQHLLRATFSNVESLSIEYVNETLAPWCTRWEQEADRRLFSEAEQRTFFTDHDMRALLRGDLAARSEFHARMFSIGSMSQNDIREAEGMNPIDNGDTYYVPVNMVRSEDAAAGRMSSAPPDNRALAGGEPDDERETPEADVVAEAEARTARVMERVGVGYREMFASQIRLALVREEKATVRAEQRLAGRRDAFLAWAGDFYSAERGQFVRRLAPVYHACLSTFGREEDDGTTLDEFAHEIARGNLSTVLALAARGAMDELADCWAGLEDLLAADLLERARSARVKTEESAT